MKNILKNIILFCIQFIEKIEYRNIAKNQDDVNLKIFETISMLSSNYEVLTDSGFKPIESIHQTQPYDIWELKTKSYSIECADKHILFDELMNEIFVRDLKIGDLIQTKTGLEKVIYIKKKKYKVSMYDLTILDENHRYYTNGILSHNTVVSGIFLTWYFCFHFDRNAMVMANKGATMIEIIDKIKEVYKHLPFFLKPGVFVNNQSGMRFDNGCRLFGQATTKTAAIGFTIHLLFCDEFAHIPASYLDPFFRSVYPTLSSSKISRMIITSTPNGMNKFYEIYTAALIPKGEKGSNSFNAMRTDYWQVPGRDEAWKLREIGNLGSEDMFNQEYGLQFITSSKTLLGSQILKDIKDNIVEYDARDIDELNNQIGQFIWDPNWDGEIEDNEIIINSMDISNGGGGDYSVMNLFVIEPIPVEHFDSINIVKDESSFFRLRQFGLYKNNMISPEELASLSIDVLDWIGWDKVKMVIETNYKGELIIKELGEHRKFEDDIFLYTKHTDKSRFLLPGIRWNKSNKPAACQTLKYLFKQKQLFVTEKQTFNELNSFGQDSKGNYKALGGNDDIAMTLVNLSLLVNSELWYSIIEDIFDLQDNDWKEAVNYKLENTEIQSDEDDHSYLRAFME